MVAKSTIETQKQSGIRKTSFMEESFQQGGTKTQFHRLSVGFVRKY